MFKKKVSIATSYEEMQIQVEEFLNQNDLPFDDLHVRMFAHMIQNLPQDQDWFDPKQMAASLRKARANEAAFYLIYPDKRPQESTNATPSEKVDGEVGEAAQK